jgi:hypothetical protein
VLETQIESFALRTGELLASYHSAEILSNSSAIPGSWKPLTWCRSGWCDMAVDAPGKVVRETGITIVDNWLRWNPQGW